MNVDTGKVYDTPEKVAAALGRGEDLVEIASRALRNVSRGRLLLLEQKLRVRNAIRRRMMRNKRKSRRTRDRMQKASRRANR